MGDVNVFIRWYIAAAQDGMLADMGAERWHTLTVLATFMDAQGRCWPSQKALAERMGVTRETANRRIQKLAEYKWRGQALISVEKREGENGHIRNVYRIMPASGLRIFGADSVRAEQAGADGGFEW